MATSSIKIYGGDSNWKLYPNKLFIVDNIADYLAYFTPLYSIAQAQYIKCELEIGVNLAIPQLRSEEIAGSPIYVSIQNSDSSKVYYYFVKERIWRSKECVRLELVMDVLNTFKEGTDYVLKDNCTVIREHKDRFNLGARRLTIEFAYMTEQGTSLDQGDSVVVSGPNGTICSGDIYSVNQDEILIDITSNETTEDIEDNLQELIDDSNSADISKADDPLSYIQFDCGGYFMDVQLFRNIDYIPENINPILQCGNAEGTKIEKASPLNTDWYLLYRNQNDPTDSLVNPVECFLIPSVKIELSNVAIQNGKLYGNRLNDNVVYFCPLATQTMTTDSGNLLGGSGGYGAYICKDSDNYILVLYIHVVSLSSVNVEKVYRCKYLTLNNLPFSYGTTSYPFNIYNAPSTTDTWDNEATPELDTIDYLDKTQAKNIKLIKLPYCPYDFELSGTTIDLGGETNWEFIQFNQAGDDEDPDYINVLRLRDMNTKLSTEWWLSSSPLTPLYAGVLSSFNPSITQSRLSMWDSKIFNSEFYQPTYYYDSFAFKLQLEKCDQTYYNLPSRTTNFKIQFNVTSTINSKFMFKYPSYKLRLGQENYANCMPIAVNNEEVLYNVPYINYVRTGYNYDVKNKNLNQASVWAGVGASAFGIGASLLMPTAPLKVAGIVTSIVGMGVSVFNAIKTTHQSEMSLQQKVLQEKNQATSVMGSDDVDLRTIYTENRLKYLTYEPTPIMKDLVNDLFFYTGYASNEMKKPTHNNRLNFDYLQMNASFSNEGAISNPCLTELVNCFANGVTYIHKVTGRTGKAQWDMDQELENWEIKLGV